MNFVLEEVKKKGNHLTTKRTFEFSKCVHRAAFYNLKLILTLENFNVLFTVRVIFFKKVYKKNL